MGEGWKEGVCVPQREGGAENPKPIYLLPLTQAEVGTFPGPLGISLAMPCCAKPTGLDLP